jgi:hypothetical protein
MCRDLKNFILDEILTWKILECSYCDIKNLIGGILVFFITCSAISICILIGITAFNFISLIINSSIFIDTTLSNSILILIISICSFFLFGLALIILKSAGYTESINKSIQYPNSKNLQKSDDHIGIIFPIYSNFFDTLIIGDSISLLIDGFNECNRKFRIYYICNREQFEIPYRDPHVTDLWIFGHGSKGSFSYGNNGDERIEYSRLDDMQPSKQYVVQLHCNHGTRQSLKEKNRCRGFVSSSWRTLYYNRCHIIKRVKERFSN